MTPHEPMHSPWVTATRGDYIVQTPFHPEIGPLLRSFGRWSYRDRAWRVPRRAREELEAALPT